MTVIGIDDTDSREGGLCTTYVAAQLAARIADPGDRVHRRLLVRLNPAVEHKTRGNAALAVHADVDPERAVAIVEDLLADAMTDDPRTSPGAVIAPGDPADVPGAVVDFAEAAVTLILSPDDARSLAAECDHRVVERADGRGVVGALAAVGAWRAFDEWTYESIAYRERERWGTIRDVDGESVRATADAAYPAVWDTLDREEDALVCVPRTPCPVLYGIRGDDPDLVESVARDIVSEPVADRALFVTNQGTDAHLRPGTIGDLEDGRAYRVTGTVSSAPETRRGGHVHFALSAGDHATDCVAFEPTKRFRDRVRELREDDRITVCGEVADGTVKLEKFALRDRVETESVPPVCPDCDRRMESAGRDQGYRCRDCSWTADGPAECSLDRELAEGWYEVPPVARRHIAKPLVRGGFDAPTHPER